MGQLGGKSIEAQRCPLATPRKFGGLGLFILYRGAVSGRPVFLTYDQAPFGSRSASGLPAEGRSRSPEGIGHEAAITNLLPDKVRAPFL